MENGDVPGWLRFKPQFLCGRASQKQAELQGSIAQALGLFLHLLPTLTPICLSGLFNFSPLLGF